MIQSQELATECVSKGLASRCCCQRPNDGSKAAKRRFKSHRALYLFPTKALAQDQLAELYDLNQRLDHGFGVFTYDGDTPGDARKAIREKGHAVLTNPDMLHTGILPHHTRWTRLFENLRYIVLDELHTYRGV